MWEKEVVNKKVWEKEDVKPKALGQGISEKKQLWGKEVVNKKVW